MYPHITENRLEEILRKKLSGEEKTLSKEERELTGCLLARFSSDTDEPSSFAKITTNFNLYHVFYGKTLSELLEENTVPLSRFLEKYKRGSHQEMRFICDFINMVADTLNEKELNK